MRFGRRTIDRTLVTHPRKLAVAAGVALAFAPGGSGHAALVRPQHASLAIGVIGWPSIATSGSVSVVLGTGFNRPYGPITDPSEFVSGRLTRTLADGSPIDVPFFGDSGAIELPEPVTALAALAVAASLAAVARSRRVSARPR